MEVRTPRPALKKTATTRTSNSPEMREAVIDDGKS
jgi:hypothetical protein